jgi:hypothetical protein
LLAEQVRTGKSNVRQESVETKDERFNALRTRGSMIEGPLSRVLAANRGL